MVHGNAFVFHYFESFYKYYFNFEGCLQIVERRQISSSENNETRKRKCFCCCIFALDFICIALNIEIARETTKIDW